MSWIIVKINRTSDVFAMVYIDPGCLFAISHWIVVNIPVLIVLALDLWSIHTYDAPALATCWRAFQSILAAGPRFLFTVATAIASDYLKE
jgi:hypothetical protein